MVLTQASRCGVEPGASWRVVVSEQEFCDIQHFEGENIAFAPHMKTSQHPGTCVSQMSRSEGFVIAHLN